MAQRPFSIRIDDKGVRRDLANLPKIVNKESQDIMLKLGKIGEEEMRRSIKDAPTPFARVRSKYGLGPPQGRARTYRMYKAVGYVLRAGAQQIQIAVGYIKGKPQDYYRYQDEGFVNKWRFVGFGAGTYGPNAPSGFMFTRARPRKTQGTHALRNAREKILRERDVLLRPLEKRIARSMGKK